MCVCVCMCVCLTTLFISQNNGNTYFYYSPHYIITCSNYINYICVCLCVYVYLHILIVNLFNFDAVVLKFTISNNKLLKLCNYRGNVRYPGVKTFNKTSP